MDKITMSPELRDKLISNGVRAAHEFGYPYCNKDNILTDEVYRMFFRSMLRQSLGLGYDQFINLILAEVNGNVHDKEKPQ